MDKILFGGAIVIVMSALWGFSQGIVNADPVTQGIGECFKISVWKPKLNEGGTIIRDETGEIQYDSPSDGSSHPFFQPFDKIEAHCRIGFEGDLQELSTELLHVNFKEEPGADIDDKTWRFRVIDQNEDEIDSIDRQSTLLQAGEYQVQVTGIVMDTTGPGLIDRVLPLTILKLGNNPIFELKKDVKSRNRVKIEGDLGELEDRIVNMNKELRPYIDPIVQPMIVEARHHIKGDYPDLAKSVIKLTQSAITEAENRFQGLISEHDQELINLESDLSTQISDLGEQLDTEKIRHEEELTTELEKQEMELNSSNRAALNSKDEVITDLRIQLGNGGSTPNLTPLVVFATFMITLLLAIGGPFAYRKMQQR